MMDRSEADRARALQDLSALADGEGDGAALHAACTSWRNDEHLRSSWHAYHLIGDVLRSEELASDGRRDADFLLAFRERMAQEPVILAPSAAATSEAQPKRRIAGWSWKAPAAVAAGFMAVAAALVVTQGTVPAGGSAQGPLAQSFGGVATSVVPVAQVAPSAAEPLVLVADGQLVRDARLQRYFAAHQQFEASPARGASAGFLRAATSRTTER